MIAKTRMIVGKALRSGRRDFPAYRRAGEKRESRPLRMGIRYIHHPSFGLPGAEDRLWGPQVQPISVPLYNLSPEIDNEGGNLPLRRSRLTTQQEQTLFLRYNYAKYRLSRLLRRQSDSCSAEARREKTGWQARAEAARDQILHANLPLVPSMVKQYAPSGVEFADLISEGNMALFRAMECFDVSRGFKFSTYACRAILACFYRQGVKTRNYRKYVPVNFDPELQKDEEVVNNRHQQRQDFAVDCVRETVLLNRAGLTNTERTILLGRFPILTRGPAMTLAQLARQVGLSSERIRQIEHSGLSKLRSVANETFAA